MQTNRLHPYNPTDMSGRRGVLAPKIWSDSGIWSKSYANYLEWRWKCIQIMREKSRIDLSGYVVKMHTLWNIHECTYRCMDVKRLFNPFNMQFFSNWPQFIFSWIFQFLLDLEKWHGARYAYECITLYKICMYIHTSLKIY